MRVSTWPTDIGYIAYCRGYRGCKVTVDGVEIERVFMADEERGEVVRAALNEAGLCYVIGDEVATETLTGVVKVWR